MSSRRVLKAAQAIREVVSMAIIADLKDPRIKDVTVTLVEVAPDMRQAKVHVSVMGDETKQGLCIRGLQSSAGYLQQKVGNRWFLSIILGDASTGFPFIQRSDANQPTSLFQGN